MGLKTTTKRHKTPRGESSGPNRFPRLFVGPPNLYAPSSLISTGGRWSRQRRYFPRPSRLVSRFSSVPLVRSRQLAPPAKVISPCPPLSLSSSPRLISFSRAPRYGFHVPERRLEYPLAAERFVVAAPDRPFLISLRANQISGVGSFLRRIRLR